MTQQTNRRSPDPLRPPPASSNWSDTEPGPPTTWTQTYPPPPPPKPARGASIVRVLGGLLLVGLIVAGVLVGLRLFRPAETAETGDARAQTLEIARFYAVDGNADAARLALAELPVANDEQWLLFTTEGALSDPAVDDATRRALVSLALELGLSEAGLVAYAEANGLVQAAAPESATVAAAMNAPVAGSAPASQPDATAPQPEADAAGSAIAGAAAVTATAPISGSAATTGALPLTSTAASSAPAAGSEPAAAAPTVAPTAAPAALTATTTQLINLRSGPGTDFPTAGSMSSADTATVLARSPAGDWLQVRLPSGATA
ncbi:MAG: SH3 domain-containing protein, partial [Caldilineaceae bacterium]